MRCTQLLLVSIALAGCGKSDKSDKQPTATNPTAPASGTPPSTAPADEPKKLKACDLISEADASAAMGHPAKYRSKDDSDSCVLESVKQDPPTGDEISFSAKADGGSMFEYVEGQSQKWDSRKQPAGVGEKAVHDAKEDGIATWAILKNGKTVYGAAMQIGPKRPGFPARLEAMMKKIAEKM